MACERQVYRLRNVFYTQIVRQDITWFDTNQSGDITTKLFECVFTTSARYIILSESTVFDLVSCTVFFLNAFL